MFVDQAEVAGTTTVGPSTPETLNIVGVGFDERFNPEATNQFKCEFNGTYTQLCITAFVLLVALACHTLLRTLICVAATNMVVPTRADSGVPVL